MATGEWPRIEGLRTVAADPAVSLAWRADPRPFHAVVLQLSDPAVEERRRQVARALHPWCNPTSPGQAHITLLACGTAPLERLPPSLHEVTVGGADSFTSAAFLDVSGSFAELRAAALRLARGEVDPHGEWVPHVTVGTYRWPLAAAQVARRLEPLRYLPALPAVGRLALVAVTKRRGRLVQQ